MNPTENSVYLYDQYNRNTKQKKIITSKQTSMSWCFSKCRKKPQSSHDPQFDNISSESKPQSLRHINQIQRSRPVNLSNISQLYGTYQDDESNQQSKEITHHAQSRQEQKTSKIKGSLIKNSNIIQKQKDSQIFQQQKSSRISSSEKNSMKKEQQENSKIKGQGGILSKIKSKIKGQPTTSKIKGSPTTSKIKDETTNSRVRSQTGTMMEETDRSKVRGEITSNIKQQQPTSKIKDEQTTSKIKSQQTTNINQQKSISKIRAPQSTSQIKPSSKIRGTNQQQTISMIKQQQNNSRIKAQIKQQNTEQGERQSRIEGSSIKSKIQQQRRVEQLKIIKEEDQEKQQQPNLGDWPELQTFSQINQLNGELVKLDEEIKQLERKQKKRTKEKEIINANFAVKKNLHFQALRKKSLSIYQQFKDQDDPIYKNPNGGLSPFEIYFRVPFKDSITHSVPVNYQPKCQICKAENIYTNSLYNFKCGHLICGKCCCGHLLKSATCMKCKQPIE